MFSLVATCVCVFAFLRVCLTGALVQEVGQQTPHDGLMADDEDVLLPLQLHDDRLQTVDQVLVRLKRTKATSCLYASILLVTVTVGTTATEQHTPNHSWSSIWLEPRVYVLTSPLG